MNWLERLKGDISEYYPVSFWSWNTELELDRIREQIREMKNAGIGGFFMHARSGLKTEYMGEDWFSAVDASIDEAGKLNMQAWVYDENGWPSGFAGMKLLEDRENLAHYLSCEPVLQYDGAALVNYALQEGKLVRLTGPDNNYSQIYAVYDQVSPSAVDVLNSEVVKKFINLTHQVYFERYKEKLGKEILGFFTDEPQYYRNATPYSPVLAEKYRMIYGEDLLDRLGELFVDCENSYSFRWKYWKMLNDLFTSSFAKQVYDWCEQHNCRLTGHAIEESQLHTQMWCCAGVMPFYEYEHIPGVDWLGRNCDTELTPRQVSSVAQQLGKKRVLTESFACTGWDVTIPELKKLIDWQFVHGVNMLCIHLTPLSLEGNRKFDHPAFFCKENPWFEKFPALSEYTAKLGCMLAESEESVCVGVIHPIHSAYLTYNRTTDAASVGNLNRDFKALAEKLGAANIAHHYIDETLLEKYGRVEDGCIILGNCTYRYIVIPPVLQLDESTCRILRQFLDRGGKLYLAGDCPAYQSGEKADLSFLKSNICFEDLKNDDYYIEQTDTDIRSTYRTSPNGDFLYAVNLGNRQQHVAFHFKKSSVEKFDMLSSKTEPILCNFDGEGVRIEIEFAPGESAVLMVKDQKQEAVLTEKAQNITFSEPILCECSENSFTIDKARFSIDGINFSEKLPVSYIAEYLIGRGINSDIWLEYSFTVRDVPEVLHLEAEKMNAVEWQINSHTVVPSPPGRLGKHFQRADISWYITAGENLIRVKLCYYQDENVYWVLNHRDEVTEGILNCLTLNTEIDNIYLHGDFSVQTGKPLEFCDGVFYCNDDDFVIVAHSAAPMDSLTQNGFPFFAGKIKYHCKALVEKTGEVNLRLSGRYGAAHIKWNEYECDVALSDRVMIPAEYVNTNNDVWIELYSGNRNLLGPFHWARVAEPKTVFPGMFTLGGSWKEGKSEFYRPSYAFVPFGATLEVV